MGRARNAQLRVAGDVGGLDVVGGSALAQFNPRAIAADDLVAVHRLAGFISADRQTERIAARVILVRAIDHLPGGVIDVQAGLRGEGNLLGLDVRLPHVVGLAAENDGIHARRNSLRFVRSGRQGFFRNRRGRVGVIRNTIAADGEGIPAPLRYVLDLELYLFTAFTRAVASIRRADIRAGFSLINLQRNVRFANLQADSAVAPRHEGEDLLRVSGLEVVVQALIEHAAPGHVGHLAHVVRAGVQLLVRAQRVGIRRAHGRIQRDALIRVNPLGDGQDVGIDGRGVDAVGDVGCAEVVSRLHAAVVPAVGVPGIVVPAGGDDRARAQEADAILLIRRIANPVACAAAQPAARVLVNRLAVRFRLAVQSRAAGADGHGQRGGAQRAVRRAGDYRLAKFVENVLHVRLLDEPAFAVIGDLVPVGVVLDAGQVGDFFRALRGRGNHRIRVIALGVQLRRFQSALRNRQNRDAQRKVHVAAAGHGRVENGAAVEVAHGRTVGGVEVNGATAVVGLGAVVVVVIERAAVPGDGVALRALRVRSHRVHVRLDIRHALVGNLSIPRGIVVIAAAMVLVVGGTAVLPAVRSRRVVVVVLEERIAARVVVHGHAAVDVGLAGRALRIHTVRLRRADLADAVIQLGLLGHDLAVERSMVGVVPSAVIAQIAEVRVLEVHRRAGGVDEAVPRRQGDLLEAARRGVIRREGGRLVNRHVVRASGNVAGAVLRLSAEAGSVRIVGGAGRRRQLVVGCNTVLELNGVGTVLLNRRVGLQIVHTDEILLAVIPGGVPALLARLLIVYRAEVQRDARRNAELRRRRALRAVEPQTACRHGVLEHRVGVVRVGLAGDHVVRGHAGARGILAVIAVVIVADNRGNIAQGNVQVAGLGGHQEQVAVNLRDRDLRAGLEGLDGRTRAVRVVSLRIVERLE